jgi:tRNA pseudouridine38-40 synthase
VIAFTFARRVTAQALEKALNGMLPPDIAVRDVRPVRPEFHPRRAARYREYRYTVWNGPRSPLNERQALGVRAPLDIDAMARAGQAFIGRHDFRGFGKVVGGRSTVRTVFAVRVGKKGSLVTIDVRANAFLRGMVRRMVAVLLEVGRGRMTVEEVRAARAARAPGRRLATGSPPRPAGSASDASPSGGRWRRTTTQTETTERR